MMAELRSARFDRRAQVVVAAAQIFCEKGFVAATVQDIAEAVGILKGSLYYYISTKEMLLEEIVVSAHEEAWGLVDATEDTADPVASFVTAYLTWAAATPHRAALLLEEQPSLIGPAKDRVDGIRGEYRHFLAGAIASSREDVDPRLAAEALLGFLSAACRSTALTAASADGLGAIVAPLAA
jgi:AcrR family transcriptional regulator